MFYGKAELKWRVPPPPPPPMAGDNDDDYVIDETGPDINDLCAACHVTPDRSWKFGTLLEGRRDIPLCMRLATAVACP